MKKEDIKELREFLTGNLAKYKKHNRKGLKNHIKLDIEKEILQEILFEDNKIALPDNLWKLLDLSDVSFDGIDVEEVNFAGSKGVVINPQKVKGKSLYLTKLTDVEIKGSFDGVVFIWTNFAGSKGAVMDLNEAKKAKQYGANLTNVEIIGLDKSQEIKQQIANSFQKIKKSKN